MTFNPAPWVVDGARVISALPRRALFLSTAGSEGIAGKNDLKVRALATPARGLRIDGGGALVLNRYQGAVPNETFTASNEGTHTLTSQQMADAANTSTVTRHFLVCVTVGDPTGNQAGHPWMTSEPIANPETFEYVRPWLIPCSAGTKHFSELGLNYPAYALARLSIPANATAYDDSMLTDLREMALPRSKTTVGHLVATANNNLNGAHDGTSFVAGAYERWPGDNVITTKIPAWAVKAKVSGFVEGAKLTKAGNARLRAGITGTGLSTSLTHINESAPRTTADRVQYNVGGEIDIPANLRGTTQSFCMQATPVNDASKGMLYSDTGLTSMMLQVIFEEVPE